MADVVGRFGYRHKGIYYFRDRPWDGDPEDLGSELVEKIPRNAEKFARWVDRARKILSEIFRKLEEIDGAAFLGLPLEDNPVESADDDIEEEEWYFEGFHPNYPEDIGFDVKFFATFWPFDHKCVSWTFIYDLDNLVFTVEGTIHFRLDNVPRGPSGLSKYIYRDDLGMFCRAPSTPSEHLPVPPVAPLSSLELEDMLAFDLARPGRIQPSWWMVDIENHAYSVSRKLAMIAMQGLISGGYCSLSNVDRAYAHSAQEKAKELLTAASSGGLSSIFASDEPHVRKWFEEGKKAYDTREKRQEGNIFWFRDRLIVFTSTLNDEGHFKSSAGLVIRRAKEKGLQDCVAILCSHALHHVAVVVITDGNVSCSDTIPLVAAYGRDEDKFKEGLSLITHYLPPPCAGGSASFSSHLPLDVFISIMEFADSESAECLGRASKALRHEWLRLPRIGPFTPVKTYSAVHRFLARDTGNEGPEGELVDLQFTPPDCVPHEQFSTTKGREDVLVMFRRAEHYFPYTMIQYQLSVEKVAVNP